MIHATEERREALHQVARWYGRNGFRTYVNDGHRCSYALDVEGRHLHPPLAVWEGQRLIRFVDVETEGTLSEMSPARWMDSLGTTIPLHVYVPFGCMERAWSLRTRANAFGAQLLTYDIRSVADLVLQTEWTPPERIHERA